ncbi:MAG: OmpA family protein, partial [Alphaproteobacteria bacterium]|nr:OmpA family protein [Alphaproteobacteria bacterium]
GRDLSDAELRHRINVIEFAIRDNSYSESDRVAWRAFLDRDRKTLRERMLTMRERRRDNLRMRVGNGDLKFKLSLNFQPDRPPPPRYVFAAEADEADLEDVLTAPPRRKISRRYTVEEVENSPDLRDAVARIEIDTVKFGFGESFVPEEEVDSLDRIAEIMEKVLAANPGEVFMIEGHTDAVGSDSANLELSRERAKAVKEALVTYYVIPPENLKTVGFGEKYLKIPTEDAEAENRRVSVARITPLVGELDN